MAKVQIVIELSEEEYAWVKRASRQTTPLDRFCVKAIANGTPLPEHHGRIIDESKITRVYHHTEIMRDKITGYKLEHEIIDFTDAPTIIEGE